MRIVLVFLLQHLLALNLEDLYLNQNMEIYDLNESSITKFIEKNPMSLILFHDYNDPKSKRMLFEFERASRHSDKHGVVYGKIDVSFNTQIAKEWKIRDIPIVYWVNTNDNTREEVYTYNYIGFIKQKLNMSSYEEILDMRDMQKRNTSSNYLMIGLPEEADEYMDKIKMIDNVIQRVGFTYLFITKSEEVKRFYNMSKEFSILSNRWDLFSMAYDREIVNYKRKDFKNEDDLINLLELYTLPGYKKFDKDLFSLMQAGRPVILFIHDQELSDADIEKVELMFMELSKKYRRDLLFSITNFNNPGVDVIKGLYNIKSKDLPYILLTHARKNNTIEMDKFRLENVKIDKKLIEKFIRNWKMKELTSFMISEDVNDEPDKRGVLKIVSKNFEQFMSQMDKDIVLLICSNSTKSCNKFDKRYERVIQRLKDNKIIFSETDPSHNEYEVDIIQNYPNIIFLPAVFKKSDYKNRFNNDSLIYEGDFTSKNVTDWLVSNSKMNLKVKPLENEAEINLAEANETIITSAADFSMEELINFDGRDGNFNLEKLMSGEMDDEIEKLKARHEERNEIINLEREL
jgi:hypothetical protein